MFSSFFGSSAKQTPVLAVNHEDDELPTPEAFSSNSRPASRRLSNLARALSELGTSSNKDLLSNNGGDNSSRRRLMVSQSFRLRNNTTSTTADHHFLTPSDEIRSRALTHQYEVDFAENRARLDSTYVSPDNQQLWIPQTSHTSPWGLGEIIAYSKDKTRVTVNLEGGQIRTMLREETRGFDSSHLSASTSDLGTLNDLHEASTLSVLHQRFLAGQCFTNIGHILISLNPFEMLPNAFPIPYNTLEPHLFLLTKQAFESPRSASILINGESGAGKTEAAKQCMRYLSQASKTAQSSAEVRRAVAQTTPLLEAFGNAKTVKNSNSSRFGRYVQILFDEHKEVCGSVVRNFLLETNRVTNGNHQERNFHIFYLMVIGLDSKTKQSWGIHSDPNQHAFLQGFVPEHSGEDDELAKRFLETSAALESVGATEAERRGIWSALALILRLGDVQFENDAKNEDKCSVLSGLQEAALLLQIDQAVLGKALTTRAIETGKSKDVTEISVSADKAKMSRDGFARALYSRIFDWVVKKANQGTHSLHSTRFIGVLDMMGFEVLLGDNSFEQLLINYSSEVLQSIFNDAALEAERRFYREEGVDSSQLLLNDNSQLLQLFAQGLFPIMDDICALGGSDEVMLAKIHDKNKSHPIFCLDPFYPQGKFIIKHFAGPVTYSIQGFAEKNKGTIFNLFTQIVSKGKGFLCEELLSTTTTTTRGSVSKQFRDSLNEMMVQIRSTDCHFVRCVRPNMAAVAKQFDAMCVNDQLLRLGVFEAVRLRREGFPIRSNFEAIPERFPSLLLSAHASKSAKEQCEAVLLEGLGKDSQGKKWQLGLKNTVFLSARVFLELDLEVRNRALQEEMRLAKLAREERERMEREAKAERDRLAKLEKVRLAEIARLQAEEEARLAKEAAEALKKQKEEEERRRAKLEAERKMLEQLRLEEERMRKENERLEALRAESERKARIQAAIRIQACARGRNQRQIFAILIANERERVKELKRRAREKHLANKQRELERKSAITIQKFLRGSLVRKRYEMLKDKREMYRKCLRANEIVIKDTLVVRVLVNEIVRVADTMLHAKGKLNKTSHLLPDAIHNKRRYILLLTRTPQTCSLLLVDPKTFEIKDELLVEDSSRIPTKARKASTFLSTMLNTKEHEASKNRRLLAVSTSSRDFVVAKHPVEWALTDLQGGAVGWISLLKDDGKHVPKMSELLTTCFFAQDLVSISENESAKVIVKQGELLVRRMNPVDKTKIYYDKRWCVLDEEKLQLFKGQCNPYADRELIFEESVEVRVEDASLLLIGLRPSAEFANTSSDFRLQAPNKKEFDSWLVAFGVAVDRSRKFASEERAAIGEALSGNTNHPLVREQFTQASHGTGALATKKIMEAKQKKKGGFDANAFKQAFAEKDKVVLANYE